MPFGEVERRIHFLEFLRRGTLDFQQFRDHISDSDTKPCPLLEAPPSLLMEVYSVLQTMPFDSRGSVFQASCAELQKFHMTFDSGADTHVLSLEAAHALFESKKLSNLRIIGVSGTPTPAAIMGNLIICVQDPISLEQFVIDLGVAHATGNGPLNLLSVSLLIKAGAMVHFERGNSHFRAYPGARLFRLFSLVVCFSFWLPKLPFLQTTLRCRFQFRVKAVFLAWPPT